MSEGQLAPADCFVTVYGDEVGRMIEFTDVPFVFGRSEEVSVFIDSEHVSREHCVVEREGRHRYLVDLESTNGTFVNDTLVKRHRLVHGDFVQIGDSMFRYLCDTDLRGAYHRAIHDIVITDGLTSALNTVALEDFLEREFARARRHQRAVSLLLLDLDKFSMVNTQLGHVAGDLVLRQFSLMMKRRIRRDELFARVGATRFAIVLPETGPEGAAKFAEILRAKVEAHEFVLDDAALSLTISLGVSSLNTHMTQAQDLLRAAESKLVEAKDGGRNRVVI